MTWIFEPEEWNNNLYPKRVSTCMGLYEQKGTTEEEWNKQARDFFKYKVNLGRKLIKSGKSFLISAENYRGWCNENCEGWWSDSGAFGAGGVKGLIEICFVFELEEDALMFKLVF